MTEVFDHPEAYVRIESDRGGKRLISVEPKNNLFVRVGAWETSYPLDLIEHVLKVKGPAHLCDEIMRDEDPHYVQHNLRWDILSYLGEEVFVGTRILDFGSGSGASSMVLARMLPASEIVGVELVPEHIKLAQHRASFYGVDGRVTFHLSPDPDSLPASIGDYDFIILSALYEHLLPNERQALLPLLWSNLRPGGVMFLHMTPYRWFLIEMHTTGLPLINYLPDRLALSYARRFSKRVRKDETWTQLLRRGIRGGATREIMEILNRGDRKGEILKPTRLGVKDHLDLWYQRSSATSKPNIIKRSIMGSFRVLKTTTGITMTPQLSLAIHKVQ